MTEETLGPDKELTRAAFEQLMQHVRKQDELVHSWTKYYLSVEAALAVALAFLIKLGPEEGILVNTGSVFIPLLGIVTSICLTNIILREQAWQARYIAQIVKLPLLPETYRQAWITSDPDHPARGYIGRQFSWLRVALVAGWVAWGLLSVIRAVRGLGWQWPW